VYLRHLWLKDFRSHQEVDLELVDGLCVVFGANGAGKSNLLEAIAFLALLESFRGAPGEALVRSGALQAFVRGEVEDGERVQLIEAELRLGGQNRILLNRQRLSRSRDLLGALRVVVFAPDDLNLLKGGPALRRTYLDQLLVLLDPRNDVVRSEYERAVRQRNALLKQTRGRLDEAAAMTLEVWDAKVVASGERLADLRSQLIVELSPLVSAAYEEVAGSTVPVTLGYSPSWRSGGLAAALESVRQDELRRGITLVGPHRDDVRVDLAGLPSRTHASQGEQRSLALALRLAAHRLIERTTGSPPLLLLDDVFSELDVNRSAALVDCLPRTQTVLTTATVPPDGVVADQFVTVSANGIAVDTPSLRRRDQDPGAGSGSD
jgi:DNA replication and repair protein RecF